MRASGWAFEKQGHTTEDLALDGQGDPGAPYARSRVRSCCRQSELPIPITCEMNHVKEPLTTSAPSASMVGSRRALSSQPLTSSSALSYWPDHQDSRCTVLGSRPMQDEERSLHLLLWAAAERQRALATEMKKRAHPAGSYPGAERRERWRRANTSAKWAGPTTPACPAAPLPTSEDCPVPVDGKLRLSSERSGHEATVTVKGELDCATAPALADELRGLLADGVCRLTVDLSEMAFIDSTGLATLVWALRAAREGGGDTVLHAPQRCVRKVLEISGADRLFVLT